MFTVGMAALIQRSRRPCCHTCRSRNGYSLGGHLVQRSQANCRVHGASGMRPIRGTLALFAEIPVAVCDRACGLCGQP
jgi:hypothetical protein